MKYTAVCKALYDYKAQSDEELTFNEDNILYILDKDDDPDWWKAQLKATSLEEVGPIGLVPANYIDEAEPIGTIEALYDYTAQQDEELSFIENDIMVLYENDDPDWFLAKEKSGSIGLVPSNYIQVVSNKAVTQPTATNIEPAASTAAKEEPEYRQEAQQPSVSVFSAISNSPSITASEQQQSRAIPNVQDEAVSWSVHEYDVDKKKKKKSKGNLLIGNGMLCYGSETDKASPVRQFTISDVAHATLDSKNIHIEISDASRTTLDFQASSKSEAKSIVSKIEESKSLVHGSSTPAAATPVAASSLPPVVHQPEPEPEPEVEPEPPCEPRWAIVLYDFDAEGPEEITVKEQDQVLAVDYVGSEDWWKIEYQDGRSGIVPATYVQFQEDYEADLEREQQQQEQEAERQQREAEAAAARQRRLEEDRRREQEERARREQEEIRRRQEAEEEAKRKEQERKVKAAAAAAAASAATSVAAVGSASPRRSQIPAPPPPNKPPAGRAMPSAQAVKSIPLPNNRSLPERPKQAQDPGKPDTSKVRTWTDRSGAFKVEAQFLGCHNDKIRLHKINGVKIDVPIQKMCPEDLRYIEQETGRRLTEDSGDDIPLAHFAKEGGRNSSANKQGWSWYDYFMRANIPMNNSLRYASTFQAEGLGENDLENLTHRKMKSLGMSESHVQRLQRFIETNVPEPASDEEATTASGTMISQHYNKKKGKKSVSFGATSVIDDSDDESAAWGGRGPMGPPSSSHHVQSQIDEDERLARQLQQQFDAQEGGSPVFNRGNNNNHLQRRGTGRPTPNNPATRGVNTAMMDKIKTQLSSTPLQPTPAAAPVAQHTPPPATPPRDNVVSTPPLQPTVNNNGVIARQQTGFSDDAWAPRATSSPSPSPAIANNVAPASAPPPPPPQQQQTVGDAMAQTKAAWSAPAPPPAPPAPVVQQHQQQPMNHVPTPPPSQPPVPLPPRQRPTPPTPQQNNKVDVQMLSQWTSPNGVQQPQQQQQQPISNVQQMAMQFGGNQQQQQQQPPPPPPRSPMMNQFVPQQQSAPQPPPAQTQFMQAPPPQNPAFTAHSPVQQNQFIPQQQQQQQQPMMMQQQQQQPQMVANVPVNAALPQPLVPMATGMSGQSAQSEGRTWANATPDNPFGGGAGPQQPRPGVQHQGSFSSMGSSSSSLQPSQVFASMTGTPANFQTSQATGFNPQQQQMNMHDPNDKYSVFKNMQNSPSVFGQGQPQPGVAQFQQQQPTGFNQMQGQPNAFGAQQNAFGMAGQQPGQQPQQQFYNRW
ncbi:hypothetical protein BDA99DRAFT_511136 [Phascolomyces articulosus]|uniref:Actin cytoskeleton-regulatory complex protein SLA1 n=1 Tax=Phascolomyces articulosus TaxID=60185 RepID=A0AAD5PDT0_9FUNG|nr:hypothetical protein BDA99DRAFT_511136 [Phascolomyces articulosus]